MEWNKSILIVWKSRSIYIYIYKTSGNVAFHTFPAVDRWVYDDDMLNND